jgi:hypothetical protein
MRDANGSSACRGADTRAQQITAAEKSDAFIDVLTIFNNDLQHGSSGGSTPLAIRADSGRPWQQIS